MKDVNLVKLSFLMLVVLSIFAIVFSSYNYTETYVTFSKLSVTLNHFTLEKVDHRFSSITLNFTLHNPSHILPLKLKSFSIHSYLNEQALLYLRRILYYESEVPPKNDFHIFVNFQNLEDSDLRIIESAETQGTWLWFFQIEVHVEVLYKEAYLDLSQIYEGVHVHELT